MIEAAWSIGIAKPIPSALAAAAVLMPIACPAASRSGPPLLPSLIAASVWSRLLIVWRWRVEASRTVISRPVPDRIPLVTESVNVPSGLPIATTSWPTGRFEDEPICTVGRLLASTFTTARSLSGSLATTLAARSRPSSRVTVNVPLPSTTCQFVRMYPFASKMKPEPTPVAGTENGPKRLLTDDDVMVTTAGLALAATSTTALSESTCTTLVVLADGEGFAAPVSPGWSSAVVPTEAIVAERSETATTGRSGPERRRRRRGASGGTGSGGLSDLGAELRLCGG